MAIKFTVKVMNVPTVARKFGVKEKVIENIMTDVSRMEAKTTLKRMQDVIKSRTMGTGRLSQSLTVEKEPSISFGRSRDSIVKTFIVTKDIMGGSGKPPSEYWQYVDQGFIPTMIPIGRMNDWLDKNSGFKSFLSAKRIRYWIPQVGIMKGGRFYQSHHANPWYPHGLRFMEEGRIYIIDNIKRDMLSEMYARLK